MELSASYGLPLSGRSSLFVYAGLPGEPAFGPPPFMHRLAALDSPEAPISHHWLDSTHISFGVVTAGLILGDVKLEASRFNGREPDQHRFDIETGPLDSTALRLSWNPARTLSLQASWARLMIRSSSSRARTRLAGRRARSSPGLSAGAPAGRRPSPGAAARAEHGRLDAFLLESAVARGRWSLFGARRADRE